MGVLVKAFFTLLSCFVPCMRKRRYLRQIGNLQSFKSVYLYYSRIIFNKRYVKKYKEYKKTRKAKLVVYSCVTNHYDDYQKIKNINFDYDYVMYTDDMTNFNEDEHIWEFRKLEEKDLDNTRKARFAKLNPQHLISEYEESLWIDSNVDIITNQVYDDVEKARANNELIAISNHPKRTCLYQEYDRCVHYKIDDIDVMTKQVESFRDEGFPEGLGLFENNIMYRKHNNEKLVPLLEGWWDYVCHGSKRDQLSLTYLAWKLDINIAKLNPVSYRKLGKDVVMRVHK